MPADTDTELVIPAASTGRGTNWTLNDLRKKPNMLPKIIYKMAENMFISEWLCRTGPPATGGSVAFREAEPLFADIEPEEVAEFGEYPSTDFHTGGLRVISTTKAGFGVRLSQEMLDDMDKATFTENTKQAVNSMRRYWDRKFFRAFQQHPRIESMPSTLAARSGGWNDSAAAYDVATGRKIPNIGIRRDIAQATYDMQHRQREEGSDEWFQYQPDTLVVHPMTLSWWMDNDELNQVFLNSPAVTEAPRYKFLFPKRFFNLNIVQSFEMPVVPAFMPDGTTPHPQAGEPSAALLLQRKKTSFISDKRKFRVTPLYEEKKNESWRSDMSRISLFGVSDPFSAMWITGIQGTA